MRSRQPQLASKIGLEAVLSQLEANLSQLEANLIQLEASWSQHEANLSQLEAKLSLLETNLRQLGLTCGCHDGDCQAGDCQASVCKAGDCQFSGFQRPRVLGGQPKSSQVVSLLLCICQEIRSPLSIDSPPVALISTMFGANLRLLEGLWRPAWAILRPT